MKKAELRVAVAKDVLKYIKIYNPKSGRGYITNEGYQSGCFLEGTDSQVVAKKLRKNCQVCGIGSMLISLVAIDNKFDFIKANTPFNFDTNHNTIYICSDAIRNRLNKLFSPDQINDIESAFETKRDRGAYGSFAERFGAKYVDDRECLKAIMKNIVKNNGLFMPEKELNDI